MYLEKYQYIRERQEYVWSVKAKGCSRCGYNRCPAAIDFHHVQGKKLGNVGEMVKTAGMKRLKAEIEKCILLCSNCHRELEYEKKQIRV